MLLSLTEPQDSSEATTHPSPGPTQLLERGEDSPKRRADARCPRHATLSGAPSHHHKVAGYLCGHSPSAARFGGERSKVLAWRLASRGESLAEGLSSSILPAPGHQSPPQGGETW